MNWLEILLNSPIENIDNICSINKNTNKLCQDKYFWELKFENDKLPLMEYQNNYIEYIREYKIVSNAKKFYQYLSYKYINTKNITIIFPKMFRFKNYPKSMKKQINNENIKTIILNENTIVYDPEKGWDIKIYDFDKDNLFEFFELFYELLKKKYFIYINDNNNITIK